MSFVLESPAETVGDDRGPATKNAPSDNRYLSFDQWKSWKKVIDRRTEWYGHVVELTREINNALDKIRRPFGFRVQQSIEQYVANYPDVGTEERYKQAFSDQVN